MRHFTVFMAAAFIFLVMASAAFAEISVSAETGTVNVSRNDTVGVRFRVTNHSYERACISLETEEDYYYISTSLSRDHFCLNRLESTWVTATIRTRNASTGSRTVRLFAYSDQGDDQDSVTVRVGQESEIELVAYPSDVCRGKTEHINVLVRNNSDEFKSVRLSADNEMLLPYFETSRLSLAPYQERYVELRIHPSPYSSVGRQVVTMYATTDDESVKETVSIDVEKCAGNEEARFSVRLPETGCLSIEKDEYEKVYFRVRNLLDEEQKVYFSVGSQLDTRLETDSAWLGPLEEREFYFEARADRETGVEDYDVRLRVWNSKHEVEKEICIRPEKEHLTSVQVRENDFVLRRYESAVFTILLKNEGDYWEEFEFSLDNDYIFIDAGLSQDTVTLERRTEKEVYVSVSVLPDAIEEEYAIPLEVETPNGFVERELRFRVVGGTVQEQPEESVEIVSHASSLRIPAGSGKGLLFTLRNGSGEAVSGVEARLFGLPEGIEAAPETGILLQPGQEREIEIMVEAGSGTEGSYEATLQVYSGGNLEELPVSIVVEGQESGLAGLTGFFAAGGAALAGLAVLIVVILALVLIARAFSKPSTKNENQSLVKGVK